MITLIPAIDIIEGQCVRLTKGDYASKKIYNYSPIDIAKYIEDLGYKRLHIVDLDGAKSNHVVNIEILFSISESTDLKIDFGGGIKTDDDLTQVIQAGARWATIGSIAAKQPELFYRWINHYGVDNFILGADVNNGKVSINGWKEDSGIELNPFIENYFKKGLKNILCTDISKDGMLQGPAIDLYKDIMTNFPQCQLIASGGVSCIEDILNLDKAGIPSVVFGKAIYEGRISLEELITKFES